MKTKRKLGIIGGMGSRAGANLLGHIINYSPAVHDQDFIEIIFHNNSAVPDRTKAIVHHEASPVGELLKSIQLFSHNEVEVIVLACITSYYFYDQIAPYTSATIINPIQLVKEQILGHFPEVRKVGLLATTGTIESGLFHKALAPYGIEVVTLGKQDQEKYLMKSIYMANGLKSAVISDEARALFLQTIPRLEQLGAEMIVGGCSEVPLALNQQMLSLPLVDAIDLLARKTVDYCYYSPDKLLTQSYNLQKVNE